MRPLKNGSNTYLCRISHAFEALITFLGRERLADDWKLKAAESIFGRVEDKNDVRLGHRKGTNNALTPPNPIKRSSALVSKSEHANFIAS